MDLIGSLTRDFRLGFFSWISLARALSTPWGHFAISNFYKYSWISSKVKVNRRCQRCRCYRQFIKICVRPKDITCCCFMFWQCEQSWRGEILIADYMITDHWSVMYIWRSYLMILSVLTMRAILRRRKYWAVRLTSPAGYFPSIQRKIRIVPVRFVLMDYSCIWYKRWQCTKNKNKPVSESLFGLNCYSQANDRLKVL